MLPVTKVIATQERLYHTHCAVATTLSRVGYTLPVLTGRAHGPCSRASAHTTREHGPSTRFVHPWTCTGRVDGPWTPVVCTEPRRRFLSMGCDEHLLLHNRHMLCIL